MLVGVDDRIVIDITGIKVGGSFRCAIRIPTGSITHFETPQAYWEVHRCSQEEQKSQGKVGPGLEAQTTPTS
jgi:hypothetical protein